MKATKKRNKRVGMSDLKSKIIKRQADDIESLKKEISELEIDGAKKDELIGSIDSLQDDFREVIDGLKKKSDEYDRLIGELMEMRKIMDKEVFKGRWNIVRLLLK